MNDRDPVAIGQLLDEAIADIREASERTINALTELRAVQRERAVFAELEAVLDDKEQQ